MFSPLAMVVTRDTEAALPSSLRPVDLMACWVVDAGKSGRRWNLTKRKKYRKSGQEDSNLAVIKHQTRSVRASVTEENKRPAQNFSISVNRYWCNIREC